MEQKAASICSESGNFLLLFARTQASAGGQANGFDFLTQSGGHACPWFQKSREPLRKDFPWTTVPVRTEELANVQDQLDLTTSTCYISSLSGIVAVNARRMPLTDWTS
jgi:hypothetical protein